MARSVQDGASAGSSVANEAIEIFEQYRDYHESLLAGDTDVEASDGRTHTRGVHGEEVRTAPLFSAEILSGLKANPSNKHSSMAEILPQYGLLAKVLENFGEDVDNTVNSQQDQPQDSKIFNFAHSEGHNTEGMDRRLFINMNTPFSAFICGSQGSGKSHTLSCMLEAGLVTSRLGPLPEPLAAMVFHYDKFTGFRTTQVCEAAYLASSGIPVKVMVSPTSYHRMREVYENLPGFPSDVQKPEVVPLFLSEQHLNVERMMKLMAIDGDGKTALYMEVRAKSFVQS